MEIMFSYSAAVAIVLCCAFIPVNGDGKLVCVCVGVCVCVCVGGWVDKKERKRYQVIQPHHVQRERCSVGGLGFHTCSVKHAVQGLPKPRNRSTQQHNY